MMERVVLDLGLVAFNSWAQLGFTVAITILYITFNIIPSFGELIELLKDKDLRWIAPLHSLLILIPFFGTLMGCDWWGRDNKVIDFVMVPMTYLLLISTIAGFLGF